MRVIIFEDKGNNVAVYTDRYIIEEKGYQEGTIYFASVCAQTQAVNAILASIGVSSSSNSEILLQVTGKTPGKLGREIDREFIDQNCINVKRAPNSKAMIKSRSVSWGRAHGLYVDTALNMKETNGDFIVWAFTMEEVKEKVFKILNSKPIPLLPEWKTYLLEVMEFEGLITPLTTYGCEAVKVNYEEADILGLVRDGLVSGAIRVSGTVKEEEESLLLKAA